jgi:lipopolysaccharide exporter
MEFDREPAIDMAALFAKAFRSGILIFSLNFLEKGLSFVQTIVLARMLLPEYFGLIGICWLIIGTLDTFSETGFKMALLQKKEGIEAYLDTAWIIQFLRGMVLYALLYYAAPLVETFFTTKGATDVLRILGITLLISSVANIGMITYIKKLDFKKQFFHNISGTLVDFTVSVSLAFYLRNVWAMVWGHLAGTSVRVFMTYLLHKFRPSLNFDTEKARELFHFGKWISASTAIIFLITNGDNAFVGKFLGIAALGFYQMAYRISNLPATEITHVLSQVTLPMYSKLQYDILELRRSFLTTLELTSLISFPFGILILLLSYDFIHLFLGEKWLPMVPALNVLCVFGLTRAVGATMGPLLCSIGRPQIQTKLSAIQFLFMSLLIYPLTLLWGILGTAIAVVIPNVLVLALITAETRKIIRFRYAELLGSIIIPLTGSVVIVFFTLTGNAIFPHQNSIFKFFAISILAIVSYIVVVYMLSQKKGLNMFQEICDIFRYADEKR